MGGYGREYCTETSLITALNLALYSIEPLGCALVLGVHLDGCCKKATKITEKNLLILVDLWPKRRYTVYNS